MKKELRYLIDRIIDNEISKYELIDGLFELLTDEIDSEIKNINNNNDDKIKELEKQCKLYNITIDYFLELQAYRDIEEWLGC